MNSKPLWLLALLPALLPPSPQNGPPRRAGATPLPPCSDCHRPIFEEWKQSRHATSWIDPIYQAALKKKKRPGSCYPCHIPETVLEKAPKKPKAREKNRRSGIHCRACHLLDGKVHGPWGAETKAHESRRSPLFAPRSYDLCLSCHMTKIGPVLPLGKDFQASDLPKKGKTCKSCHMPLVERPLAFDPETGEPTGPKRLGRSHRLLGPRDPKFLAKAFGFEVKKEKGKVRLSLLNKAGHRIPGLRLRSFEAEFEILDAEGKSLWSRRETIDGSRERRISVGGRRDLELEMPPGGISCRVRVRHFFKEDPKSEKPPKDFGVVFEARK